ncbi:MAG: esterase [Methylotenera sp.]|nr:MAG: esterase [Methylotenera sp.]
MKWLNTVFFSGITCLASVLISAQQAYAEPSQISKTTTKIEAKQVLRNIAYGPNSAQKMDIYIPPNVHNANIIFMVHGGAWRYGDKAMRSIVKNKSQFWLAKNTIFISTNYRLLPEADPLTQAEDIANAIAFAKTKASEWGGNPEKMIVMGHSAGAHLVALVISTSQFQDKIKPILGTVLLDSAALDLPELISSSPLPLYKRAFGNNQSYWLQASPYHQLNKKVAPVLIVCSTRRNNACSQAQAFSKKLISVGGISEVLPVDLSHLQINEQLGIPSDYTDKVDYFITHLNE